MLVYRRVSHIKYGFKIPSFFGVLGRKKGTSLVADFGGGGLEVTKSLSFVWGIRGNLEDHPS